MTKAEIAELRRIVKERFKLLGSQLYLRRDEIRKRVSKEVDLVLADQLEAARSTVREMQQELAALEAKWAPKMVALAQQGVIEGYEARRLKKGGQIFSSYVDLDDVKPSAKGDIVDTLITKLENESGYASMDLRGLELDLLERLALQSIESNDARDFLSSIPKPETILPLPDDASIYKVIEDLTAKKKELNA